MRVHLLVVAAVVVLSTIFAVVHPSVTSAAPMLAAATSSADSSVGPAVKLSCLDGKEGEKLCTFDDPNYGGNLHIIGESVEGCFDIIDSDDPSVGIRSYRNKTIEGLLYEGANCDGRSKVVTPNSDTPDLGFVARSWKKTPPLCANTEFCAWEGADYSGRKFVLTDAEQGACTTGFGLAAQSYINNTNIEGYFYESAQCDGRSRPVTFRSQDPDIGFTARSFKHACVSCRSGNGNQ